MLIFLEKFLGLFSRQENAYYKSQRLACCKDLELSEDATWREIIDACDKIAPMPSSLMERARILSDTPQGEELFEKEALYAASAALEGVSDKQLVAALRVEERLMGLNLGWRDHISR